MRHNCSYLRQLHISVKHAEKSLEMLSRSKDDNAGDFET